ncbi:MAG: shikimate kinase [Flavobacterium sp.]
MRKIVLVGYMAVGKTTIAQLLAEKIKIKAIDLDKIIESEVGLSISQIFEQKGEIYFRKIEHELFKKALQSSESLIISTGGGTPCYANNHLLLKDQNVVSVYLKASLGLILDRLKAAKKVRPVVASKTDEELEEFVAKHLFERSYFYHYAGNTIAVDNKTPEEICLEIIALLG